MTTHETGRSNKQNFPNSKTAHYTPIDFSTLTYICNDKWIRIEFNVIVLKCENYPDRYVCIIRLAIGDTTNEINTRIRFGMEKPVVVGCKVTKNKTNQKKMK